MLRRNFLKALGLGAAAATAAPKELIASEDKRIKEQASALSTSSLTIEERLQLDSGLTHEEQLEKLERALARGGLTMADARHCAAELRRIRKEMHEQERPHVYETDIDIADCEIHPDSIYGIACSGVPPKVFCEGSGVMFRPSRIACSG
jgi:hypothetical protein